MKINKIAGNDRLQTEYVFDDSTYKKKDARAHIGRECRKNTRFKLFIKGD